MRLLLFFLMLLKVTFISSVNLRNISFINEVNKPKSDLYKKLVETANQTFYLLYNIQLDFKDKNYAILEDETKYLRVILNENETIEDEGYLCPGMGKDKIFKNAILYNLTINIFGRNYYLVNEFFYLYYSIKTYTDIIDMCFFIPDRYINYKSDSLFQYLLYLDKDKTQTIEIIVEDKNDKVSIKQSLNDFWDSIQSKIPEEEGKMIFMIMAEFIVVSIGIRKGIYDRRKLLVQKAHDTFYQLYNISLNFNDKNMISYNDDSKYYKIVIMEYPKYEGLIYTNISIKNGQIFLPEIPNFSLLTFELFGRTFNLKEELLSISYLFGPTIEDGIIRLEKLDLEKFDSQITYKCELFRENEETQGGFAITFEDKDDKNEIENTLNNFWKTWSNKINKQYEGEIKLLAQYVVTTFGIWHNIANRYDKIIVRAKDTLYQLLNITIDFNGRHIYIERNEKYEMSILIDEYPTTPIDVETYINISNGRPYFPNINYSDVSIDISNNLFDVEEEYKAFGSIFASGMRNGKVIIYKKNTEKVSNVIRFKCFVYSQNNEEYGAFEISITYKEPSKIESVKSGIQKAWDWIKKYSKEFKEVLVTVSEIVGVVIGIQKQLNINSNSVSSSSSYLCSSIYIMILSYLLILIIS